MGKISMGKSLCVIVEGKACFIAPTARAVSIDLVGGTRELVEDKGGAAKVIFHLEGCARVTEETLRGEVMEKAKELVELLGEER